MLRLVPAAAALLVGGCGVVPMVCTDEARSTLAVTVLDARTGAPAAGGARGAIHDGAYSDSLFAVNESQLVAVNTFERPGTYDVTVQKPGFRAWSAEDVKVTADACHVRTRTLEARLEPLP